MQRSKLTYRIFPQLALTALALLIAVVSFALPYAQANLSSKHALQKMSSKLSGSDNEKKSSPDTDSPESETECFSIKEFLSDSNSWQQPLAFAVVYAPVINHDTYIAFHGEQLVPPPDFC